MKEIQLLRTDLTADGVFGQLLVPGHIVLHTAEDDYRAPVGASCIPAGHYTLTRTMYFKHGYPTFEVTGVPHRSRILIHPGNTEEDTLGCILVGLSRGPLVVRDEDTPGTPRVRKRGVLGSRVAFKLFMSWMAGVDTAPFLVTWAPGLLPAAEAA